MYVTIYRMSFVYTHFLFSISLSVKKMKQMNSPAMFHFYSELLLNDSDGHHTWNDNPVRCVHSLFFFFFVFHSILFTHLRSCFSLIWLWQIYSGRTNENVKWSRNNVFFSSSSFLSFSIRFGKHLYISDRCHMHAILSLISSDKRPPEKKAKIHFKIHWN